MTIEVCSSAGEQATGVLYFSKKTAKVDLVQGSILTTKVFHELHFMRNKRQSQSGLFTHF